MKILFVHQNFPAQFKHLAPALQSLGHDVRALAINNNPPPTNIEVLYYQPARTSAPEIHPWLIDLETKVIRAEAAFYAALKLRDCGFNPDVIIAHPAWGEALFLKEVWPTARLGLYAEFYYHASKNDLGFDPEFANSKITDACSIRLKNTHQDLQFTQADALISPTHFQASTIPQSLQEKITVIHEGIDTQALQPNAQAELLLNGSLKLTKTTEIITLANRSLEPIRGFHIFMRALPELLRQRPNAQIIIVGDNHVSYGNNPPVGTNWKNVLLNEVSESLDKNRVHFVGKLSYPNFVMLLQLSTVHVYLTYPYVLSWSLLEAMSLGCAIVASNTAPVQEVINHNETGRLVDFFDQKELIAQIVDLLQTPSERDRLGKAAREHIVANYDLRTICLPKQLQWVKMLAEKTTF